MEQEAKIGKVMGTEFRAVEETEERKGAVIIYAWAIYGAITAHSSITVQSSAATGF